MIRRMIKIGIILTLLGLALDFTNADAASKYRLNKTTVKVTTGKTVRLKVKNSGKKRVKWKSNNRKIATVSSKGLVKGKKAGKTVITAKIGKKRLKCRVTVKKAKKIVNSSYVHYLKFIKAGEEELFTVGDTYDFASDITSSNRTPAANLSLCPRSAIKKLARFSSSDTSVAGISKIGKATFKKTGKAVITIKVKTKDGWKTCREKVNVINKDAVSFKAELLTEDADFKDMVIGKYDTSVTDTLFDTMKLTVSNRIPYTVKINRMEMDHTWIWSNNGTWRGVIEDSGWVIVMDSLTTMKEDRKNINIPVHSTRTFVFSTTNAGYKKLRGLKNNTVLIGWFSADGKSMDYSCRVR